MWENKIDINKVVEIRAKTTTYFGVGAINKMTDIADALSKKGIKKTVVITGKGSHIKTGAWDAVKNALESKGIGYVLYSKITPNPTVNHVDEILEIARNFGATSVIAIGGGSPIDAAKGVAALLPYPDRSARELMEFKFIPETAAPLIAINLTHGTGTEVDRFAVISIPEKNFKPALAYDCLYPMYSIDDPSLMSKLPADQTAYVTIDALNHVVEAATTIVASPFSISLAKDTIELIAKYLPITVKDPANLEARYFLVYASMIAGISFDNGFLHLTHALEHPMSGVKPELAHGLGLAMLLPSVVKTIYPAEPEVLADILEPITGQLKGTPDEAEFASVKVKEWLKKAGINTTLKDVGFKAEDVDKLTNLAFETPSLSSLLSLSPVKATKEVVRDIYIESL